MPSYDLLIKGGRVIDAANGVDGLMDVGVSGRSIGAVEPDIPESQGRRVVDATGMYVTPGLIDIHAHCTGWAGSMFPEEMCFPYGVTTMVDCGGGRMAYFRRFQYKRRAKISG